MDKHRASDKPVIGISCGDINGIGLEIILKTLQDNRLLKLFTPVVLASSKVVSFYRKHLKMEDFNYHFAKDFDQIHFKKVNVLQAIDENLEVELGQENERGGKAALQSLQKAVELLKQEKLDALVTAPISKKAIQEAGFTFPGHTEFLTDAFEQKDSLMLLIAEDLRVGVATGHIPLKEVAGKLSQELINQKLKIMEKSLMEDFGINKPKIAVLGLNPHAGENGKMGTEETEIIAPLVKNWKERGKLIYGPYPADGFFGTGSQRKFDAILAMYHDQGLTPFKTIAFDNGVNFTAGLPIIRTSPDHGTAFDIAGKGIANEESFRQAVFLALELCKTKLSAEPQDA